MNEKSKKIRYVYFLSYSYASGIQCGNGRLEIVANKEIKSMEDIIGCERSISEINGYEKIVVLNYQLLRTEEVDG
jgi:hypothetical protein